MSLFRSRSNNANCSPRNLNANNAASNTNRNNSGSAHCLGKKKLSSQRDWVNPRLGDLTPAYLHSEVVKL